jgi:hypothetical protein
MTKRLETGDTAAFVRLRPYNGGRSTARNVAVRVLKVHRWDDSSSEWIRSRPELDGRLLQQSNHLASEPDLVDVFPYSDRIVDLASVDLARVSGGANQIFVEISHPWPPNEANIFEPAAWRLELLVCGDNIGPERTSLTLSFDRTWPQAQSESRAIWEHFFVDGPLPEISQLPTDAALLDGLADDSRELPRGSRRAVEAARKRWTATPGSSGSGGSSHKRHACRTFHTAGDRRQHAARWW